MSSHLVLVAKNHTGCLLWKSKLAQIALVGPIIYPQNGHRDNFTREPFDDSIRTLLTSLTSGFVLRIASTLHSSFRMPAWELLQWKMARNTYTCRLEVVCAREASKTTTVQIGDVTKEHESSVF